MSIDDAKTALHRLTVDEKMMPDLDSADLNAVIRNVYEPAGMKLFSPVLHEAESADYGACRFRLDGHNIVFRVAKTTPTKIGQFVTLWKRRRPGDAIEPLDAGDPVDFVVVCTSNAAHHGQFIFTRKILIEKGVISSPDTVGKRAIRVYPPWSNPVAIEAVRTQKWQLRYFLDFSEGGAADPTHVRGFFTG
ncbi:MepB family protein [Burkholderia diffusa]|uniref:MepB family protein n=1 Tax=Burkholderia diffusa TaxID=488732 RepID=UPI0020C6DEF7|nr:MepB family protein [Burkholderia diffusa]